MTPKHCLNCGKKLSDKFCSSCGQKADTHRITFRHFIFHDVLHGVFHVEKGILFTAKQALVRPGEAALDYISGKRIRYYNVFYLILITFGVMLFVRHLGIILDDADPIAEVPKTYLNDASRKMDELITQKNKLILMLFVPFSAVNSYILFRKSKLNLSEHCIISGMVLLGILLLSTMGNLYFPINNFFNWNATIASYTITFIILLYVCYAYFNAFQYHYTKWAIAIRIILFYIMLSIEIFLLFLMAYGYVTDWKFGVIQVTPFD